MSSPHAIRRLENAQHAVGCRPSSDEVADCLHSDLNGKGQIFESAVGLDATAGVYAAFNFYSPSASPGGDARFLAHRGVGFLGMAPPNGLARSAHRWSPRQEVLTAKSSKRLYSC